RARALPGAHLAVEAGTPVAARRFALAEDDSAETLALSVVIAPRGRATSAEQAAAQQAAETDAQHGAERDQTLEHVAVELLRGPDLARAAPCARSCRAAQI